MANFRLVKIQATVETPATLLLDRQLNEALAQLRETLHRCGLNVLSVEPIEPSAVDAPMGLDADPWSIRGVPVP
jgi:hypothetical protein